MLIGEDGEGKDRVTQGQELGKSNGSLQWRGLMESLSEKEVEELDVTCSSPKKFTRKKKVRSISQPAVVFFEKVKRKRTLWLLRRSSETRGNVDEWNQTIEEKTDGENTHCVIGPWDLQSTHRERGGRWREGEREREGAQAPVKQLDLMYEGQTLEQKNKQHKNYQTGFCLE